MHHTAVGHGHSAGNEVIQKIEFVICQDKEAGGGGQNGAWVSERRRRSKAAASLEPERTQQCGQTPNKELDITHITLYVSGYTETNPTGMLSRNHGRQSGANKVG